MRLTFEYPSEVPDASAEFLRPSVMTSLAVRAEELGYHAIAMSDHPAPSARWRRAGGHDTLEPAVALGFMAAATTRIQLMTNLYVLPFRNPYLTAKALTSLDIVSGGRLIAGVGAGYLRSEFETLGAEFDSRAADFDRCLGALVNIWTDPEHPVPGVGYQVAEDVHLLPPVQRPHPPIWIGGNSGAARRRVVRYGSGWSPVLAPPGVATSIRTQPLDTVEKFGAAVRRLKEDLHQAGRDPDGIEVQVELPMLKLDDPGHVRRQIARLRTLRDAGATRAIVHVDAGSAARAGEYIEGVAASVAAIDS